MSDEIVHLETESSTTEAAAAEALASVAETAIEETAARVEELALARAEVATLRTELSALHDAFRAHSESNTVDFDALRRDVAESNERVRVLEAALIAAEEELAAMEMEVEEVSDGVEDVAEAQAQETPPVEIAHIEHEREAEKPHVRSRHFIRI